VVNRNSATDSIKGVMIILVVFGHIIYKGNFQDLFLSIRDLIYIFHMPIFLMLSGFYFKCKLTTDWLKNITIKLVLPYLMSFSFYLLMLYIVGQWGKVETSNHINDVQGAFKAIFISPFSSYWYLHSLIVFSLFFYTSNFLCSRLNYKFLILPATLALYSIFHYFSWSMGVKFFYWVAAYIWLGYAFHSVLNSYQTRAKYLSSVLVLSILLVISSIGFIAGFDLQRLLLSLIVLLVLHTLFKYINCKFLSFVGRNSLLIFLFHVYFLNISKFFSSILLNIDNSGVAFMLFSLLLSVSGSILIGWLFDRLNISKYVLGSVNALK
jgi:fucose 4-O-acetylase-like acetyltransferase